MPLHCLRRCYSSRLRSEEWPTVDAGAGSPGTGDVLIFHRLDSHVEGTEERYVDARIPAAP